MGLNEKILLADDQQVVIEGITPILEREGHTVIPANSVRQVQSIVDDLSVDISLALVDNRFPKDGDGKRAADYIRSKRPGVRVASFSSDRQTWGDTHIDKGGTGKEISAAVKAL